jgi:hypothetical protein
MYVMRCEGNPRPRTGRTQAGDAAMIKLALCDPYSLCPSLGYCFFLKLLVFHFLSPDPAGQVTSSFVFLVKRLALMAAFEITGWPSTLTVAQTFGYLFHRI